MITVTEIDSLFLLKHAANISEDLLTIRVANNALIKFVSENAIELLELAKDGLKWRAQQERNKHYNCASMECAECLRLERHKPPSGGE